MITKYNEVYVGSLYRPVDETDKKLTKLTKFNAKDIKEVKKTLIKAITEEKLVDYFWKIEKNEVITLVTDWESSDNKLPV